MSSQNETRKLKRRSRSQSSTDRQATRFDANSMQQGIAACRSRLDEDPGDLAARLALSWRLLFQSLYYQNQQSFWTDLLEQADRVDENLGAQLRGIQSETAGGCQDYRLLLRDSLMQAATVAQLSDRNSDRDEALRIRELVQMCGGGLAVEEADLASKRILGRIAKAVCSEKKETEHAVDDTRGDDETEDL
jgi:hypothetical protein